MPSPELCLDIWGVVADTLGEKFHLNLQSLRNLCLTCKAIVPLCCKYLFSTITLTNHTDKHRRLQSLILYHPSILPYVRHLEYKIFDLSDNLAHTQQVLDLLIKQSKVLQDIKVWTLGMRWDSFPGQLQITLDELIHMPGITSLNLSSMQSIPSTLLSGCISLKRLDIRATTFIPPNDDWFADPVIGTPKPQYLVIDIRLAKSLEILLMQKRGPNGTEEIINFSNLTELEVTCGFGEARNLEIIWKLLYISTAVESIKISTSKPIPLQGLGAALLRSPSPALKKFTFDTKVTSQDDDPLCGLVSELRMIAENNIIEDITLNVRFDIDMIECRDVSDQWLAFDWALNSTGGFPMLKVVRVYLEWIIYSSEMPEFHGLARLSRKQFPNLSKSKSVDFYFVATNEVRYDDDSDY